MRRRLCPGMGLVQFSEIFNFLIYVLCILGCKCIWKTNKGNIYLNVVCRDSGCRNVVLLILKFKLMFGNLTLKCFCTYGMSLCGMYL